MTYTDVINGSDPQGTPTPGQQANPYWMQGPEGWAADHERQHHDEALYRYGEYAMFVLMWRREDFDAGLVTRCSECFGGTAVEQAIAQTYQQPTKERCPTCFGTTYEGGIRAKIVRPSLWEDDSLDTHQRTKQGEVIINTVRVQSTSDFHMRNEDYILRSDGTRWSVANVTGDDLNTGFAYEGFGVNDVAINMGQVKRQDEGTVVFDIPPDTATLKPLLSVVGPAYPSDFSAVEEINGPLIPDAHKPEG